MQIDASYNGYFKAILSQNIIKYTKKVFCAKDLYQ
jgi:hypothetical protein